MQKILSCPDLRPGQEKFWIRIVQDPLDAYLTVDNRRALVFIYCCCVAWRNILKPQQWLSNFCIVILTMGYLSFLIG